jgi:NosR/NirI family nitrous oxide reductase transcriptional regulator
MISWPFDSRGLSRLPALMALLALVASWLVCPLIVAPALAEKGRLRERLTPDVMAMVYPAGADRLGPEEGSPPAIAVYKGDKVVAYIFSTLDIIAAVAYAPIPYDVIAGVEPDGHITGAKVVFHREPYVYHDPVRQPQLDTFLANETGSPLGGSPNAMRPDYVAQATITARLMRAGIHDTARLVLATRVGRRTVTEPTLDVDAFVLKSWNELVADGSAGHRRLTSGDVAAALAREGKSDTVLDVPLGKPDELYSEIFFGLMTPAGIGANVLGVRGFEDLRTHIPDGAHVIFMASNGPYDFHGTSHFWKADGYRFNRVRIVQGDRTIGFVHDDYQRLLTGAAEGLQSNRDAGLFTIPASAGFDPVKPWRLEFLVNAAGQLPALVIPIEYKLPASLVLMPPAPSPAMDARAAAWIDAWHDAKTNVAILAALLIALTAIFVFQDRLSRSRRAHRLVRTGFLLVVLVWLGWTAGAQLSIVNVISYIQAPFRGFGIGVYLAEPLMVMIAAYTLVSLVVIGRGVFCGWLCPFGALQELLGQLARARRAAMESVARSRAAPVDGQVHRGGRGARARAVRPRRRRIGDRDRAVQDRDHLEVHPRLALCDLRGDPAADRPVLRARLLPLPVPARRRARGPRPAAPRRPPQAASRVRQPLPSLRAILPGASDRAVRQDHHRRMLPVPRLPGRVLRRQALPAAGAGRKAPRRRQARRRSAGRRGLPPGRVKRTAPSARQVRPSMAGAAIGRPSDRRVTPTRTPTHLTTNTRTRAAGGAGLHSSRSTSISCPAF